MNTNCLTTETGNLSTAETANDWKNVTKIELVFKSKVKVSDRPRITCSKDLYALLLNNWDGSKIELFEQFKIMLLNSAQRVMGIVELYTGGITECAVDQRLIWGAALTGAASSIVLCHNHPSGNLNPSHNDAALTHKTKEAASILGVALLDHLIISPEGYYSFADNGTL